jgi:hypothetical protein
VDCETAASLHDFSANEVKSRYTAVMVYPICQFPIFSAKNVFKRKKCFRIYFILFSSRLFYLRLFQYTFSQMPTATVCPLARNANRPSSLQSLKLSISTGRLEHKVTVACTPATSTRGLLAGASPPPSPPAPASVATKACSLVTVHWA